MFSREGGSVYLVPFTTTLPQYYFLLRVWSNYFSVSRLLILGGGLGRVQGRGNVSRSGLTSVINISQGAVDSVRAKRFGPATGLTLVVYVTLSGGFRSLFCF